jgi:hypothetical protein
VIVEVAIDSERTQAAVKCRAAKASLDYISAITSPPRLRAGRFRRPFRAKGEAAIKISA